MRKTLSIAFIVGAVLLAGCFSTQSGSDQEAGNQDTQAPPLPSGNPLLPVGASENATFAEFVVDPAIQRFMDLYEPTIDVSKTGTIYIAGHTIAADTTGAPAFVSRDDGATWEQLPFVSSVQLPGEVPGGSPPPSDEIFIVAGDDGWAYGADITALTYPVTMWSGDGETMAYHSPNQYNRAEASSACHPHSLADRPWVAYANGTLLLVNNPGGVDVNDPNRLNSPVQVGVMSVPPTMPTGAGAPVVGTEWNNCASPGGDYPGIPDIRDDGLFAVPQVTDGRLFIVVGHRDDVQEVEVREVFEAKSAGSTVVAYGHAVFDGQGDLFVGLENNTFTTEPAVGVSPEERTAVAGRFKLAVSQDGGHSFKERSFVSDGIVRSLYMDGSHEGSGALVVWAVDGEQADRSDWYVAHAKVGPDGAPIMENVILAVDEGPPPSSHVTGAAVGPDGRAYLAMYDGAYPDPTLVGETVEHFGSTPLSVWIQQDGPRLT